MVDKKKWFSGIDSIRFILALVVLLSHFDDPYVGILLNSSHQFIRLLGYFLGNAFDGTAAVIAFFIISGFVIHFPNKSGIKDLKSFWTRRFLRVFIPLIIISFIGIWFKHPEKAVVWSLICELIYYAIYPFMAKVKISWFQKFVVAYIVAAIVIIAGAKHDLISLLKQTDVKYHSYYWQLSFLTFIVGLPVWLLGVIIAEKIDKLHQITFEKVFLLRISVFILSVFFTFGRTYLYISYIISMNIFAILIYRWIQAEIVYFKTRKPIMALEKMGKFSYSLYLCHPLIYHLMSIWIINSVFTYPLLVIISIPVAYVFYLCVEKPSHHLALELSSKKVSPNSI
jgi:peptidoglycan/LPS O-acetylase OafA/YrhL